MSGFFPHVVGNKSHDTPVVDPLFKGRNTQASSDGQNSSYNREAETAL